MVTTFDLFHLFLALLFNVLCYQLVCFPSFALKDTPKAFGDFKNKQQKCMKQCFLIIFWKCIQYTLYWDKTQMLKKFPSNKINGAKNALFFLPRAVIWFQYKLKQKVRLSKTVYGIFHFRSLYFCSTICMDCLTLKRHNSFQN